MSLTNRSPFLRHGGDGGVGLWNSCRAAAAVPFLAASLLVAGILAPARAQDDGDHLLANADFFLLSGSGHQQGPFVGSVDVNALLGAPRFYNAGFTGTNAVMANIEAGHIWTGHDTLAHVGLIPLSPGARGEIDRHATWVAMVMGGRPGGSSPGDYQHGMAPDARLASGAIATGWPTGSTRYTAGFFFSPSGISTYGPYRAAAMTGVPVGGGVFRRADVINSSFVIDGGQPAFAGIDQLAGTLDALFNVNPRTLMTVAAGNTLPSGEGPNRVNSPATGYNNMSVAALRSNGGAYNLPSAFSNGGPNDYFDPIRGFVREARQVVDIAAPGESFSTAYYGGETGGNGPTLQGQPDGPAGGADWYTRNISGTSFAAPTVAGGAALLYDAAYARLGFAPDARDARVMKAVLMNSADKTLGWDNGQVAHPNGNGGVLTTQGLDDRVGAGRMNLSRAFDQLLRGTTDVAGLQHGLMGAVQSTGWDFGEAAQGITNDYVMSGVLEAGWAFTATLSWFRDRVSLGTTNFTDASYDNLDLELWDAVAGSAVNLISESKSRFNNSEHFKFAIPTTGQYILRVRWTEELFDVVGDVNVEQYGLAWMVAVPEPGTLLMFATWAPVLFFHRKRRTL